MKRNLRLLSLLSGALCLSAISLSAKADIGFNYEPGTPMSLGKNIDLRVPSLGKEDCVDHDAAVASDFAGSPSDPIPVNEVRITSKFIDSYQQLYELFSLNAELKAEASIKSIISIKADTGLNTQNEFTKTSNNAMLVVIATYDFGARSISNSRLKPEFKALVESGKSDEVRARCGTHFVAREQRWAFAALTIKADDLNESVLNSIKTHFSGEGSVKGFGSASTNLQVDSVFKKMTQYSSVSIDFLARGGDPTRAASLAKVVAEQNITNGVSALSDYMMGVKFGTSVPSKYWLVPLPGLPPANENPEQIQFLRNLYFIAIGVQADIDMTDGELRRIEQAGMATARVYAAHKAQLAQLQSYKSDLEGRMRSCIEQQICGNTSASGSRPSATSLAASLNTWELSNLCVYGTTRLSTVELLLQADFFTTESIVDLEVYKTDAAGQRTRTNVSRTRFESDPSRKRVAARIDNIDASRAQTQTALADLIRDSVYELKIDSKVGLNQWYVLGSVPFSSQDCPLDK